MTTLPAGWRVECWERYTHTLEREYGIEQWRNLRDWRYLWFRKTWRWVQVYRCGSLEGALNWAKETIRAIEAQK